MVKQEMKIRKKYIVVISNFVHFHKSAILFLTDCGKKLYRSEMGKNKHKAPEKLAEPMGQNVHNYNLLNITTCSIGGYSSLK